MTDSVTEPGQEQKTFKQRRSFESRVDEVVSIKARFPQKIPVIVERHAQERDLPVIDKTKFLVPDDLSMSQFFMIIRNKMKLKHHQALFLLINKKSFIGMNTPLGEVYKQEKDKDGFLYIIYASQPVFG